MHSDANFREYFIIIDEWKQQYPNKIMLSKLVIFLAAKVVDNWQQISSYVQSIDERSIIDSPL